MSKIFEQYNGLKSSLSYEIDSILDDVEHKTIIFDESEPIKVHKIIDHREEIVTGIYKQSNDVYINFSSKKGVLFFVSDYTLDDIVILYNEIKRITE